MDENTEITRSPAMMTAKPKITTEDVPYTYVSITVQTGDRDGIEFRREFDPTNFDADEVLRDLSTVAQRYLHERG